MEIQDKLSNVDQFLKILLMSILDEKISQSLSLWEFAPKFLFYILKTGSDSTKGIWKNVPYFQVG